jgi:predicted acylesterase/phospholipase RssA
MINFSLLLFYLSGVFQCVRQINNDCEDVYVDGGLLCNYPIHAFDGKYSIQFII